MLAGRCDLGHQGILVSSWLQAHKDSARVKVNLFCRCESVRLQTEPPRPRCCATDAAPSQREVSSIDGFEAINRDVFPHIEAENTVHTLACSFSGLGTKQSHPMKGKRKGYLPHLKNVPPTA
jgi:hypothetical protein